MNELAAQGHDLATWFFKPVIPATYAKTVLNVARSRGLNIEHVACHAGLDLALLDDPAARVLPLVHMNVVQQILSQTGDHGLGFEIGLALPLTSHGDLGFAVMCAGSLCEVFDLLHRFWNLQEKAISLVAEVHPRQATITLTTPLQLPAPVEQVYFECLLAMIVRALQMLTGSQALPGQVNLKGPERDYVKRFAEVLPPLRFNMPNWQYTIPVEWMEVRLPMSNPDMLAAAVLRCERELAMLAGDPKDFMTRVQQALTLGAGGYPDQQTIARHLNVSVRTFRRRLLLCGTSYRELLELAQRKDAVCLLESSNLKVQQIAARLGYLNSGNFSRAFKSWTGLSPEAFRRHRVEQARGN
ncbi:AraC family transcriptional regulator [Limnobacter litoralis]|uniref:AraC family transcriptional regulator n=1 Tax=Limnobacter litoralis TaxID=481366 RepID=A0ABQ5YSI3_9BURK|nr:AraC family transcriptional regulator [Limnobacter litoralis]GLR27603.1 AraC family transcriptional regulator [Limnobacter litoralis]